jgi:hypothetical protein
VLSKEVAHYIIDQDWSLDEALDYLVKPAIKRIGEVCGADVAQALKDGAVKTPHQDIIRWSRFNPRTMKDLVPHIKQGCSLDEAIQREENRITNTFSYLTKQKSRDAGS